MILGCRRLAVSRTSRANRSRLRAPVLWGSSSLTAVGRRKPFLVTAFISGGSLLFFVPLVGNFVVLIVIIVIIGCGTGVLTEYLKTKRKTAAFEVDESLTEELERLRARVEVLEAIVTDEKYNLRKEIDGLEQRA